MPYATRADLIDRFGEAEIEQRESMLPAGAVDRALTDTAAEIDGYVGRAYPVPLSPVPVIVASAACDIARYRLLGDAATEDNRARYKDAVSLLKEIGAGRVEIGMAPVAGGQAAATVEVVSAPRVFGRPLA